MPEPSLKRLLLFSVGVWVICSISRTLYELEMECCDLASYAANLQNEIAELTIENKTLHYKISNKDDV
jgi:hypothetical protein